MGMTSLSEKQPVYDSIPCILLVIDDGDYVCVPEVENVRDLLEDVRVIPFRDQARMFFDELAMASPYEPSLFPTMHADIEDDGLFVEWILGNTRAGFWFSSDPSGSEWFVLSKGPDGTLRSNGGMDDIGKAVSEVLGILETRVDVDELRRIRDIPPP